MYHLRAIVYICNLMVRVVSIVEFDIVMYQLQNYAFGFHALLRCHRVTDYKGRPSAAAIGQVPGTE